MHAEQSVRGVFCSVVGQVRCYSKTDKMETGSVLFRMGVVCPRGGRVRAHVGQVRDSSKASKMKIFIRVGVYNFSVVRKNGGCGFPGT